MTERVELAIAQAVGGHERWHTAAHAVIEAMREPTDEQRNNYFAMKKAAGNTDIASVFVDAEWERMIDAALI